MSILVFKQTPDLFMFAVDILFSHCDQVINLELALADLGQIEKRLERLGKGKKTKEEAEKAETEEAALKKITVELEAGRAARTAQLSKVRIVYRPSSRFALHHPENNFLGAVTAIRTSTPQSRGWGC